MKPIEKPTEEQLNAVRAFAKKYGKGWKQKLNDAWYKGSDAHEEGGALLRQVRNNCGPEWLETFVLEERKRIGVVRATVEFPLYEGDEHVKNSFDWFQYAEPGIVVDKMGGHLATCRRDCKLIGKPQVILKKE